MGLIAVIAPIAGRQFAKRKPAGKDANEVMAAEEQLQRERGLKDGAA